MLSLLLEGLGNAAMMAWQIWWALVLGFAISAMVQAWAPRERIEALVRPAPAGNMAALCALDNYRASLDYIRQIA